MAIQEIKIGDMIHAFGEEWCVTDIDGVLFLATDSSGDDVIVDNVVVWATDSNGGEEEFTTDQIDHITHVA